MTNRFRLSFWYCVLLVSLVLLPCIAAAQTPLGKLVGTARDDTAGVLPGVTVTITNEGTNAQLTVVTGDDGSFVVPQLPAGYYTVKFELQNFKSASYDKVKIDPGQEYSLAATLELGSVTETVSVTAGADLVHTTTTEIVNTVQQEQVLALPLPGRNPIELIRLQAGVPGIPTRTNTAINGGRPSWTQVTQDGINVQDNFIRTNSLDFVPNRPTSDTIGEFTIVTNTQGVDAAGGSSQVKLITPSGTNEFHGSVFELNRHSALAATSWFNNRIGLPTPYLNRNQFGGRTGGPIVKSKLFFFAFYEGFRQTSSPGQNLTIPRNADFGSGVFRYVRTSDGAPGSINVLTTAGLPQDPKVASLILSRLRPASAVNNSDVGDGRNTGGFRFNQTDYNNRNQGGARIDFQLNPSHHFEGTFTRFRETDDRTDIDMIHDRPLAFTDATVKFFVGAWRWSVTPRLQNELRAGANLAPVAFENTEDFGDTIFNLPLNLDNPVATFQPQGRDTRTRQFIDNASFITGNHSIQFGGSLQQIRVNPYNFVGRFPVASFGFSAAAPAAIQLTQVQFPGGISAADLGNANAQLAFLSGTISQVTQRFQVRDRASGFVPGIPNDRNFSLDNWNLYVQDSWRLRPNLTVRGGLKWEYYSPLKEDDNLQLLPVLNGRSVEDALLDPNGRVDFVDGGFYNKDLNNLGGSFGVAWDPFSDGKTSVRAAYTLAFVNEETLTVARNASNANAGLDTTVLLANQFRTVNAGVPVVPIPALRVPRTFADQLALSVLGPAFSIDPDIQQPRVHQFNVSVERELGWNMVVEARYVGTLGRDIWRGIDLNQIRMSDAFFQDFLRARSNGFLALAAGQGFNPAFNPALAGSQNLTVIPQFGGGILTNATVRAAIQQGEPARLADFYVTSNVAGARQAFFPNPGIYEADLIRNGDETDYHAVQLEARRRFKSGIFGQVNYTFGKTLANSTGTLQSRFEPFLDNARPELERTRALFHISHIVHANFIFELPFGEGKRFLSGSGLLDRIVGGWQLGSIIHWQSGAPISILSARGTFNRVGRSGGNPAFTNLSRNEIKKLFGIRKLADGRIFYIDPAVIDALTGRAVGPDNLNNTGFAGQVFFNPTAGTIGNLQRLQFDGPSQFAWDLKVAKRVRIAGKYSGEFQADFFNLLNHPGFFVGDTNVNSATFGRISRLNQDPRTVQLALKLNF